ncbi:unnamed protein product, partial [Prorocentrum cordatum]
GSNNFIDQIKCRGCGELLYKYNFAKVNDQMLLQCVRSRQYFDRLETTGSAQPGQAHPTGPSSATEDEVIRKLTDAEVEQIIENERMKIREEERSRLIKAIRMPTSSASSTTEAIRMPNEAIRMPTSSVSQQEPDTVITMVVDERSFVQQPPPEPDGGFHHLA